MVCIDLLQLRRGKMHNKAENLDMFNKYCCSLFVRRRNDPLSAHVHRSCQGWAGQGFPADPWGDVPWALLLALPFGFSVFPDLDKVRIFPRIWWVLLLYCLSPASVGRSWWECHTGSVLQQKGWRECVLGWQNVWFCVIPQNALWQHKLVWAWLQAGSGMTTGTGSGGDGRRGEQLPTGIWDMDSSPSGELWCESWDCAPGRMGLHLLSVWGDQRGAEMPKQAVGLERGRCCRVSRDSLGLGVPNHSCTEWGSCVKTALLLPVL